MRLLRNIFIVIVSIAPTVALAATSDSYTLLSPLGTYTSVNTGDADAYFNQLFFIFIAVAAILAVIRLMICGLQYMASEAVSTKGQAKQCIWYVIGGLFLILLSFIILQTINPGLTGKSFNDFFRGIATSLPQSSGDTSGITSDSASVTINNGNGSWYYTWKDLCTGQVYSNQTYNSQSECTRDMTNVVNGSPRYSNVKPCELGDFDTYHFKATDICTGASVDKYAPLWNSKGSCDNVRTTYLSTKKVEVVDSCQPKK